MSSDINHVVITGRLTADAQQKVIGDKTVFSFSIAVNHYDKKEGGDVADFFNVTLWSSSAKQSEYYAEFLTKGSPVVTDGRLSQDRWAGQDGKQMSRVGILANSVTSMGGRKGGESSDSGFPSFPG